MTSVIGEGDKLPFAAIETRFVTRVFSHGGQHQARRCERLQGEEPFGCLLHIGAHGYLGFLDAAIRLGDGSTIDHSQIPALDLSDVDVVIACSCEFGLSDNHFATRDNMNLADAFRLAGASCVVAAQWTISDFATFLIVSHLSKSLLAVKDWSLLNVSRALRKGQLWLRDSSAEDFLAWFSALNQELAFETEDYWRIRAELLQYPSGYKPFSNEYYWSAFSVR